MKINLTDEQLNQILKDGFLDIGSDTGFGIYVEVGKDMNFQDFEINHSKETQKLGHKSGYCFGDEDIKRLLATKPGFGYTSGDWLCPNCETHLIYNFEHCPKCGQAIKWEADKENMNERK